MKWFSSNPGRSLPLPALQGKIIEVAERNFKVEEHLGDGGFAVIYRVRDLNSKENFALKHVIMNSEEAKIALREEAKIMKKVQGHPHVISLHSVAFGVEKDGQQDAYMIMDLCTESLFSFLQKSNFKLEDGQIMTVFLSVCKAVLHLHSQKHPVLHRDIKVENVLKRPNGNWILCDFGSARSKSSKHSSKTKNVQEEQQEINKTTTPAYRAPEMWDIMMGQKVDEKADIWALGCMLYLLCFGTLPFTGESQLEVMAGKSSFPKTRSPSFTRIISEMLHVDPKERPTIDAVIALLETPQNQVPPTVGKRSTELTPEPTERRSASLTMGKTQTPERSSAPPMPSREKTLSARPSLKGDKIVDNEARNRVRSTESPIPIPKIAAPKTSAIQSISFPDSTSTNIDLDERTKSVDLAPKEGVGATQVDLQEEVKALKTAVSSLTENNQLLWSRIQSLEKTVKSQEQIIVDLQNRHQESTSVEKTAVMTDPIKQEEAKEADPVEEASSAPVENNKLNLTPLNQEMTVEVETPSSEETDSKKSSKHSKKTMKSSPKTSGKFGGTFWKTKAATSTPNPTSKIEDNHLPNEAPEDTGGRHKRVVSDPPPLDSWHPASGN